MAVLGIAPVQEATELAVPAGVAVGDGGGPVVGAVDGDAVLWEAGDRAGVPLPPITGAEQAPSRISAISPAAPRPTRVSGTRDNLA